MTSMPILDTCNTGTEISKSLNIEAGNILMQLDVINGNRENDNGVEADAIPIRNEEILFENEQSIPPVMDNDVVDTVPTREDRILVEEKQESLNSTLRSEEMSRKKSLSIHDNSSSLTSCSHNPKGENENVEVTFSSVIRLMIQFKYILTRYSILDLILTIGSIGLYIFDSVTDVLNGLLYLYNYDEQNQDNLLYFYLTMVFIIIPSIVMQIFSMWWEVEDRSRIIKEKKKLKRNIGSRCLYYVLVSLPHLLQIAPIFRYVRSVYFGVKSRIKELQGNDARRNFYHKRWKYELCDVNFLRLFESFLESGTQLVLQIYIMLRTQQTPFITVLSCSVSLFGMAAVFVAYQRSLRDAQSTKKNQISIFGSIILFLYRTCTILARVLALSLLLNVHIWAWIGLFLLHWICMSAWVSSQNTTFCKSRAGEFVYDVVIGFCYNFAYINVHQGHYNRYKMLIYYIIMGIENIALALSWFYLRNGGGSLIDALFGKTNFNSFDVTAATMLTSAGSIPDNIALVLVLLIPVLFFVGILLMLFYYALLHPKPKINSEQLPDAKFFKIDESLVTLRSHCGDNYRYQRKSPLFRSWHSGCVDNGSDFQVKEIKLKQRRCLSDIDIRDEMKSHIIEPSIDRECTARNEPLNEHFVKEESKPNTTQRLSAASEAMNSPACSCYSLLHSSMNYNTMSDRKKWQQSGDFLQDMHNFDKLPTDIIVDPETGIKRRQIEIKLERKQKEKEELERRRNQLLTKNRVFKQATLGPQDLFNRRERAKYFYTEAMYPDPDILASKTKMSKLQHTTPSDNYLTPTPKFSGSGTFPRCSKSQFRQNPYSTTRMTQGLKPICENKATTYSTSLSNITQKQKANNTVPRATTFIVSHNEKLVSIESSL